MSKLRFLPIKPTISFCKRCFALIFSVSLIAAEARRGFSSSGSGSGSYDSSATTNSWDLSATPDADCLTLFTNSACADLTRRRNLRKWHDIIRLTRRLRITPITQIM